VVVAPGDNPDMATELAALVVSGVKRATASLVRDFSSPDNPSRLRHDAPAFLARTNLMSIGL
jgi:uncharacterized protein YhfF